MIISACGNDCSLCPRFMPKTHAELSATAKLWYEIGYRDRIVLNEEIACYGCRENNWCRYDIVKCTYSRGISNCGECKEYPCEKINQTFISTMKWEPRCKEVCTNDEYETFDKAFFHKKNYLDRQHFKLNMQCHIDEISEDKLDEYALVIRNGFKDIAEQNGFTVESNPHHGAFMRPEHLREEKHNGVKMYAMYCNDTLCGAISLVMHDCNCEIEHFCVIPEFRHLGLGAFLIKHCVSKAQELGFCEIRAGIIDSNKVLKEWYIKNGFEEVEKRNYPGLSFTVCNIKYTINKK